MPLNNFNSNLGLKYLDKIFHCHIKNLEKLQCKYFNKYDQLKAKKRFSWQKSFHYSIIKNEENFCNYVKYLQNQWIKHHQLKNKYCYIDKNILKSSPVLTGEDPNLRIL